MITLPVPHSTFSKVRLHAAAATEVSLLSAEGFILEVRRLNSAGWCLELRYDAGDTNGFRQPYTGRQEQLEAAPLKIRELKGAIQISSGDQRLTIDRSSGKISLKQGRHLLFETIDHPFTRLDHPADVPEGISSPKIVELSSHPNFHSHRSTYRTRMTRFEYPVPAGQVLGLPGSSGELNRNGYRFELYNTDRPIHTPAQEPLYQSWPILMHRAIEGDEWIGVFHDNPSRTFVDIGAYDPERTIFESLSNNTRVYLMSGPDLRTLAHRFSTLLGTGELPPLWAFGYHQCRYSYMSTKQIRSVDTQFRKRDIPLDAIYFDIDYMDGYRVFTCNPDTFGDLRECIEELHRHGRKAVCIIDPGVKVDPGYHAYEQVYRSGRYLKQVDGQPWEILCWPGRAILPDFGDHQARSLWALLQSFWLKSYPFDGVWNDMNEPSNFDGGNTTISRAHSARGDFWRDFNLYGYGMAQASHEGWLSSSPGRRGVVITRSGYPGVQQHAVIWYGDNHAWWEHLRFALDTCISYALAGVFYSGTDLPGFSGDPPDDLAVRFFQLGTVLPLFRGHSNFFQKDKEPYAFGEEAQAAIRDTIRLRYSLLREYYSGFEAAFRTGQTPILPVQDSDGTVQRDQFVLFDKFLVAPVVARDQSARPIYLPKGRWYRLGNPKETLAGGRWISEDVDLTSLPIFVREGSIVVRNTVRFNTETTLGAKESFEIYPNARGTATGYWFDDDGETIDDPHARRERLRWSRSSDKISREPV